MVNIDDIREILYNISNEIILPSFGNLSNNQISYKNEKDIVTEIDIKVEQELYSHLSKMIKDSKFIGEETYSRDPSILNYYISDNYCWTVDPIDGTSNFAKSKERFAVMVSLTKHKQIIQSFIYKPISEEFMFADKTGTFFNNKKIKLSVNTTIENSNGSISTKYWDGNKKEKLIAIKDKFKNINSYGSIGCEYFDIVLGIRDFALLSRLYPWDHIPGVFIVRQAGGHDCHFDKLEYKFYENSKNLVVSSSKNLNYQILNLIGE